MNREYTHFCLFAGMGGASIGLNRSHARVGRLRATARCLGGIDVMPEAVADFTHLTGSRGTLMDLFDEEDYLAFHGKPPPPGWAPATPTDILEAAGFEYPDILFTSPPCKGFSGLLNKASASSEKYQALNRLTVRGLTLALEAFKDQPPKLVLLENVPRIQTRGRPLLDTMKQLLRSYGYTVAESTHDCGELGGLAQHRKRFLLVARHSAQVAPFLYEPPKRRVRSVGEVLDELPLPEAEGMHGVPQLQWKTWVRLALIEAGKDWRSLNQLAIEDGFVRDYRIKGPIPDPRATRELGSYEPYGVVPWSATGHTVTSQAAAGAGPYSVADPRLGGTRHNNVYRVVRWDRRSPAVTSGTGPSSGGLAVADPRVSKNGPGWANNGHYGVVRWDDPAPAVTGHAKHDNGRFSVADPRAPTIISLDGTWHRPFTTLELAALQGFPVLRSDWDMNGNSQSGWRLRIGNAIPPPTAEAIGSAMLETLLRNEVGESFRLSSDPIWVKIALSMEVPS